MSTRIRDGWSRSQAALWRSRASAYSNLEWATESAFLKAFLAFCPVTGSDCGIDVGTGTGIVAKALAPHAQRIVGIDICQEMLSEFKQSTNQPNIHCYQCDVQNIPFEAESFDFCTARMVFHHVEDCLRGVQEVMRVLKPGGHLVLLEGVPPDHRTRERYEQIFRLKEKRHTFSEAELINLFHRAGFANISLHPYFMEQVSLKNWLENSALTRETMQEITRLHVEADDYFKAVYNLHQVNGDVFMDWKFAIVVGMKP